MPLGPTPDFHTTRRLVTPSDSCKKSKALPARGNSVIKTNRGKPTTAQGCTKYGDPLEKKEQPRQPMCNETLTNMWLETEDFCLIHAFNDDEYVLVET